MHQLTISIDPELRAAHGPELAWSWRTLLAGLGYAWRELPPGAPADLAYTPAPPVAPARLWVRAAPARWAAPASLRLAGVETAEGWRWPRYAGDDSAGAPTVDASGGLRSERDLIFDLFWLLSGQEEAGLPHNVHGHLDLTGTPWLEHGGLRAALASGLGAALGRALVAAGLPPGLSRWPHGYRAAAAASHDVDYPQLVPWLEPLRVLRRQGLAGLGNAIAVATGRRHHWHFWSWVGLERQLGAPSAFYFVPRRGSLGAYALGTPDPFYDVHAPRFRRLLGELAAVGWEIGLHASYRAHERPDAIAGERAALEAAAGVAVVGNRHHYWRLDLDHPDETLLAHERAGLAYDASLAHDRYLGWRRGSCWPFFPFHRGQRRALRTLQLPTGWMDAQLFLRQAENPGDPQTQLRALAATAIEQGGMLLIDIHDYVYDDALFPGWRRAFAELFGMLRDRGDVWLARPRDLAAHWAARQATIERASLGLE